MIDVVKYKAHIYDVVGALHEVHRELGPGLNESCYQEGLEIQLQESGIKFCREQPFHPRYHGKTMHALYRIDFLCKGQIVVECKAVSELNNNHRSQLFNYLRLLELPCGILVIFSPQFATIERYFYDTDSHTILGTDGNPIRLLL